MKDFKILKIKSGSTIQKVLSLKNELGEYVEIINYDLHSQIRNSKGELVASATFTLVNPLTAFLTYSAEDTLLLIKNGRMSDLLYMDVALKIKDSDIVIHSETIKLEVDRGITEVWNSN